MTSPRPFHLKQQRGSWIAKPEGPSARRIVGDNPVAVLRDWEQGTFDWNAKPPTYTEFDAPGDGGINWWQKPAHEKWRGLLVDNAIVWVRQHKDDGSPNGTVGRSKGVWRIADVEIDEEHLHLVLIERVGDVRT